MEGWGKNGQGTEITSEGLKFSIFPRVRENIDWTFEF
jgi:hypothetical protein